jgi:hypothetical protein
MIALLFSVLMSAPFFQPPTVLLPTEAFAFEFPDAAFAAESIERFEVVYDSGAWVSLGIPVKVGTTAGISKYKLIPPQTSGTHVFQLRACNAVGCGPASSPFAFAPLSSPTTGIGAITKVPR